MVNITTTERQKGPDSPRTEVGEIDTRAPFQSVKAAVSLFGEVAFSKHKSTPKRSRLSAENVLNKEMQLMLAQKELVKVKQNLENGQTTKARALADFERAKMTLIDLSKKLETVNTSKQTAVQQREENLEHEKSHGAAHSQEIEVAREQYVTNSFELDAVKQKLNKIRRDFNSALEAKTATQQQAAEAQRAAAANSERVNELLKEISDMKEAIQQLKFATTQNQHDNAKIMQEKGRLEQYYRAAVRKAEKKLDALKQEYDPDLTRSLEVKLAETTLEIETLREKMKRAHASEMNTVKAITDDLNEAIIRLQEVADEECSLRTLATSFRIELENVKREHGILKEESFKLEQTLSEAESTRKEAQGMHRDAESLKKEAEAASIAAVKAEKTLELVLRQVKQAKAAEQRIHEEMQIVSQKEQSKKKEASASMVKITLQDFGSLKTSVEQSEKMVQSKLAALVAQLEEINERKNVTDKKLEADLKAIGEIKIAKDLAMKSAEKAEAAKGIVQAELRRWRQQD